MSGLTIFLMREVTQKRNIYEIINMRKSVTGQLATASCLCTVLKNSLHLYGRKICDRDCMWPTKSNILAV